MSVCGCCESRAVARVTAETSHGIAHIETCGEHIRDGYAAASILCKTPSVELLPGFEDMIGSVAFAMIAMETYYTEESNHVRIS